MENALKICKHLYAAIAGGPCEGEIVYIDRNEIDVDSPVGIVRIFSEGVLRPYSCLAPSTMNFGSLMIKIGMKVFLGPEEIDFNDIDLVLSLKMVEKVDLSVTALGLFLPMDLKQRLRYLQRAVELSDDKGSFSNLLFEMDEIPYSMDKRLTALTKSLKNEEFDTVSESAKECSGLGEGRYPASDLLLCGYMQIFNAISFAMGRNWENVQKVNMAILKGAAANTTRESGFLLWLSSNGLSDESGCNLIRCLLSDKSYASLLAAATSSVNRNGCDWMTGICMFLRYFAI